MAKNNSSKKSDTESTKSLAEEKPQEQANIQETTPKKSSRGQSKRNTLTPRQEQVLYLIVNELSY